MNSSVPLLLTVWDTRKIIEQDQKKNLKVAMHCLRREDDVISDLNLLQSTYETRRRGRPHDSYIKTLKRDTGLSENDLRVAMIIRDVWKSINVRESIKIISK